MPIVGCDRFGGNKVFFFSLAIPDVFKEEK
jgi:hypothetical protein